MNPPSTEGLVARGVRVTLQHHDAYMIGEDDDMPASVTARVIVNGLLAGKATVPLDDHRWTDEEAASAAIGYAWMVAERRMAKWRKGLARWEALPSSSS